MKLRSVTFPFDALREAALWLIGVVILLKIAFSVMINLVIFAGGYLGPVYTVTGGLVQSTLIVNLAEFLIIVGIILTVGGLRAGDLGLRRESIPGAVVTVAGCWVLVQVAGALWSLNRYGTLVLADLWQQAVVAAILGAFLAQVFGNALFEETLYRGFLLPQFFIKLRAAWLGRHPELRLAAALLISQSIFALLHIPNRIYQGIPPSAWIPGLVTLLGMGVLYAFVYLRTQNLFIAVGLHALVNMPVALFLPQSISRNLFILLALLIAVFWPVLTGGLAGIRGVDRRS